MNRPLTYLLATILLFGFIVPDDGKAQAPRESLDAFTGSWEGPFVVYRYDGTSIDSLVARHDYRWDGDVQVGEFVDRYPATGREVRSTARNFVTDDGTLICEVTTEEGTTTRHTGRIVDGGIVWSRKTDDGRVESFRERVVTTPDGREYRIDGFGVYPNDDGPPTRLLFVGRYRAVE